ncbi:hypothetical protein D3C71_1663180 [compost metagenome]
MERLDVFAEAREAQGCDNPDCQECGVEREPEPNFEELLSKAVAEGIAQHEKKKAAAEKKATKAKPAKVIEKVE